MKARTLALGIALCSATVHADLIGEISADLARTEKGLGGLSGQVDILNPYLPDSKKRSPRSGTFRWACQGLDTVLIEHTYDWVEKGISYRERSGEMLLDGRTFLYSTLDGTAGRPGHSAAGYSRSDLSFANPIFCYRYAGLPYSELVKLGSVASNAGDEATITGTFKDKPLSMVVVKQGGRWCIRSVAAAYSRASRFELVVDGWTQVSGSYVPTKGSFWAGAGPTGMLETFETRGFVRSDQPIDLSRALAKDSIVSAEDGVYLYGSDGKLRLLRATLKPAERPLPAATLLVIGAASGLGIFVLFRRRWLGKNLSS